VSASQLIKGGGPKKKEIHHKDFLPNYLPQLVNDIAAARRHPGDPRQQIHAVLDSIAVDLTSNNRASLVARYDRRGAMLLGNWGAELVLFDSLSTEVYGSDWSPPARFRWQHVTIDLVGPRNAVVYAQFLWHQPDGDSTLVSYTGVFAHDGKRWRIRAEHESPSRDDLKKSLCKPDTSAH